MAGKKFTFKKKADKPAAPPVELPPNDNCVEDDSLDSDLEDFQFLMKNENRIPGTTNSTSLDANDLAAIITTHSSTSWSLPCSDNNSNNAAQKVENSTSDISISLEIECDEEVTIVKQNLKPADSSKFSFASIRSRVVQQKNEETKNAWKGLMSKMQGKSATVSNGDSKNAWKGLMSKMQSKPSTTPSRNAPKRQAKGKPSSVEARTFTKKVKSEMTSTVAVSTSPSGSFASASTKVETTTTVVKKEEDISVTEESNTQDQKVPARICPLFLMCKKSTTVTKIDDVKPWDLVHTDNPWLCDSDFASRAPEELTLNDNPSGLPGEREKTKKCPFYKFMPDTRMSVDAFDWGVLPNVEVYLLSHFHADHYGGLTRSFNKTIVCSRPTGTLVKLKLGVAEECIRKLDLNRRYIIDGVELVLIDANHCPGSVMFIIRLRNGRVYLHTGDFRYTPEMIASRLLENLRVDCLYLDTTYLDPQYVFPSQSEAINEAIKVVKKHIAYRPKTLILCGTYCIGKERVFCAVADAVGSKAFCLKPKRLVIEATENQYFIDTLSDCEDNCQVHVVPMQALNPKALQEYLSMRPKYSNILGIKPTGWEFSRGVGTTTTGSRLKSHHNDSVHILGIPYSEHSSFEELRQFVKTIRPVKIKPTVNVGNPAKRSNMMQHLDSWLET